MTVYEAIQTRRSVRAYRDEPVSEAALQRILEAVRLAPSGNNSQPWKFVIVRDGERRRQLAEAAHNQMFIASAPVVIVAVGTNPDVIMSCDVPAYAVNVAIALDHLTLAAVEEGLGTCWICAFSQDKVRDILGIPKTRKVVALTPLGVPADTPRHKSRKPLSEIICEEVYVE